MSTERIRAHNDCSQLPCDEPSFDYTKNWVAAGIGGGLFSTGVLVAATGGTRTVIVANQPPAGAAPLLRNEPGESVAAALAELDALRDQGFVSDDEYAAKRTEIMGRL